MSNVVFSRAVGQAFKQSKGMPPVGKGKNPLVGFALGFLFGPFGVGLYLQSFGDFFVTLAIVLGGTFVTGGVAAPILWVTSGAWAYVRIKNSNNPPSEPPIGGSATTPQLRGREGVVPLKPREVVVVQAHDS
jgi:hypothetical protein